MIALALDTAQELRAARYVIAVGVVATLHVGKLPPALPLLREAPGISLLPAGFLLSLLQLAGLTLGLTGMTAQRVGVKRTMVAGLMVLGCASVHGGLANGAIWLLATRAPEGLGFLCISNAQRKILEWAKSQINTFVII